MPYQPDPKTVTLMDQPPEKPYWRSGQVSTPQHEHIWVAYAGDVTLEIGTGKPLPEPDAKFWAPARLWVWAPNARPPYPIFFDEPQEEDKTKEWFPPIPVPPGED